MVSVASLRRVTVFCSLSEDHQYEYSEDLGVTAVALYDYQAGETQRRIHSLLSYRTGVGHIGLNASYVVFV